jgi:hypothetical protein
MPRCYLVKKVKHFGIRDWGGETTTHSTIARGEREPRNNENYRKLIHLLSVRK